MGYRSLQNYYNSLALHQSNGQLSHAELLGFEKRSKQDSEVRLG